MMKSAIVLAASLAACLSLVAPASAVDLENDDEDSYEITIAGNDSQEITEDTVFELAPGGRQSDVCMMRCMVKVEGIGSIVADEDEVVVIRDGRLSKLPKRL